MADGVTSSLAALLGYSDSSRTTGSADINSFVKTLAGNDYWRMAANPLLSAKFDTSTWKPGTTAAVTAGQSFLGALLNGLGQRSEANQLAKVAEIMPQLQSHPDQVSVPEGVDPEAFGTLKLATMARKQQTDEDIRKLFATTFGGAYDSSTGEVTPIKGASDVIAGLADIKAKAKGNTATGSRANVQVADTIGKLISAHSSLNQAEKEIKDFPGGEGTVGGIVNWLAKQIPGTKPYQYQKDLPALNDPLTQAIAGSSKMGTLLQTKQMLSQDFGQSPESMIETINKNKGEVASKITNFLETLKAAGWPEQDAPAGYKSLSELRDQFAKVATGATLNDIGAAPAALQLSAEQQAMAKKEIDALILNGASRADAAATVRAKYMGGLGG